MKAAPHLNSKKGEPYHRTMPSMMKRLKEQSKQSTAKRVLQFVRKESGGVMEACSAGALPRGRQQINDCRKNRKENDPLYALMLMCKEAENNGENIFIRQVNAAPYTMVVLASEYTLNDLLRFCTNREAFSILNVDPTFNLGQFDVTVTTYRHMLLRHARNPSGRPPVMLGPLFIHLKKDFSAYHFFSSSLISLNRDLRNVQAIGTDGEAALVNAMATSFPVAIQLRCFLHFKSNVERKLHSLNLPKTVVETIVSDVMGCPTQLQLGVVDAETPYELDKQLKQAESRWNALEQPYRSPPEFHKWFMRYCRDTVADHMVRDVRSRAGLGNPPDPFYTNAVESMNKVLKQAIHYQKCELPDFVRKMQDVIENQKQEIQQAIIGIGEYRLSTEHENLCVQSSKWFQMTKAQRDHKLGKFMKAQVSCNPPVTASVCPLDALCLPAHLCHPLWKKAQSLVADESTIVMAPGYSSAWLVQSEGNKRPHYVTRGKSGGFLCDSECLGFKSAKVCSHCVAIAIKTDSVSEFVKWFKKKKVQPNLTSIAEFGKPSSTGKKPRKGTTKKTAEHIKTTLLSAEESDFCNRIPISSNIKDASHLPPSSTQPKVDFSTDPTVESDYVVSSKDTGDRSFTSGSLSYSLSAPNCSGMVIGGIGAYINSPPPLIQAPMVQSSLSPLCNPAYASPFVQMSNQVGRPPVDLPFWVVTIFGNVSRCQGCKGKIRRADNKKPLPPPNDIVLQHQEYVVYNNPRTGRFEQSREKRNVYYHPWRTCVAPHFLDFSPSQHIAVSDGVQLLPQHKELLRSEFGVFI